MAGEIRNVVRRLDRNIPVVGLSTMERDIAASVADRRLIRGLLFGIEPTDPGTFLAVTVFVFLVAVLACAVPTWRAVRSDPKVALQAT